MQIVDGDFLQKLLKKAKGEINNINKQNSVDDIDSIESTISGNGVVDDWSPTVSNVHSRQNTFYEEGERQQQEKESMMGFEIKDKPKIPGEFVSNLSLQLRYRTIEKRGKWGNGLVLQIFSL
jgi:hypothetical protein